MESMLFDEAYQKQFLAHCLRNSDFLNAVVDDLDSKLFPNEAYQRIVLLLKNYHTEYKAAPGTLAFRFLDFWKERGLLHETVHASVSLVLDDLFAFDLHNKQFLLEQFNTFSRQQLAKSYILPFSEHIKKGEFERAEELMAKLFQYRPKREHNVGSLFSVDPTARIMRRRAEETNRLWTLIPELDMTIDGLRPKEVGLLLSQRTSVGKSAALQFFAKSAAFQGKKVLIVSLEMSKEAYEDRMDQVIAGVVRNDLTDYLRLHKAMQHMTRFGGSIWIHAMSPGTPISQIRKACDTIRNVHNWTPDLLVLDYADECGPETPALRGDLYASGAEIFDTLNAWIDEDNLACWTASQGQRSAGEEVNVDTDKVAGSIAKVNKSDLVLGLSRSPDQVAAGKTTIFVSKNREGRAKFAVEINTDFEKMAFWKRADQ